MTAAARATRCLLVAVLLGVGAPAVAEEGKIVVLAPVGPDVKARQLKKISESLEAGARQLGVDYARVDIGDLGTVPAGECVRDASCLAVVAVQLGATKLIAPFVLPSGNDLELDLVLFIDGKLLAGQTFPLAKDRGQDAGVRLAEFMAALVAAGAITLAKAPATAPVGPAVPDPTALPDSGLLVASQPATRPGPEPEPLAVAPVTAVVARASRPPQRVLVLARIGGAVTRGDLGAGVVGGLGVVAPISGGLSVVGGLDYHRFAGNALGLTSPPDYPRGLADVTQSSSLYAVWAGAEIALLRVGPAALAARAALGAGFSRSELSAFGAVRASALVSPLASVAAVASGRAGRVAWSVELGWREVALAASAAAPSEGTASGLLVVGSVGVAF